MDEFLPGFLFPLFKICLSPCVDIKIQKEPMAVIFTESHRQTEGIKLLGSSVLKYMCSGS